MISCKRPEALKDWQSSVSPEIIEAGKKLLVEKSAKWGGAASFGGVGKGGSWFNHSRACHASMGDGTPETREVIVTSNLIAKNPFGATPEMARPFLKWFLADSPYAFIILNRDDLEFCENYGFVIAGDVATTLVQSACIITRHFYECYPRAFTEFNKLVDRGIDGLIAYQICFNSNISTSYAHIDLSAYLFVGNGGHRVSQAVGPEWLLNYYTGTVSGDLSATYTEAPTIYGSTYLFAPAGLARISDNLYLQRYRKSDRRFHNFMLEKEGKLDKSVVYRPPNPFTPKPANYNNEHSFTCQQAVTDVADYLQNYVKESLNV